MTQAQSRGLCDSCVHRQLVPNTRGSVFSLCLRSRSDPSYPRYPRLPVVDCRGYEPTSSEAEWLPHIDEHAIAIEAGPDATWEATLRIVEGSFASPATARVARLLGCAEVARSGPRPLAIGSTIPGFRVRRAEPGRELALVGSHRFSSYALIFRLDDLGEGRTHVRAETRAEFPGLRGSAYRALVIGTRGHVLVVRRLLGAVKRRAERDAPA